MDLELKPEENTPALPPSGTTVAARHTVLSERPKNTRLGKVPPQGII